MKYGAFSNESGSIEISWTVVPSQNGDRLRLNWTEQAGAPVFPPVRKGFGLQVIERGLAQELDGSVNLDFQQTGLIFTLNYAVSPGARAATGSGDTTFSLSSPISHNRSGSNIPMSSVFS
jgi:two-component sensor histidine kinase